MDKFEFGDIYKFLVSAGIVLLGLSIVLPWLYFKEPFDLLIEKQKILLLTDNAKIIIANRQSLIGTAYILLPWISAFLLASGIFSISVGLYKWFKKQKDIDKRDLLTTQKLENEVKGMSDKQINQKAAQEFKEAIKSEKVTSIKKEDTKQTIKSEPKTDKTKEINTESSYVESYLSIERYITEKISKVFQYDFNILSNKRLGDSEYDLILNAKNDFDIDSLIEIKYYPQDLSINRITEAVNKFYRSSMFYSMKINRRVIPVFLIVAPTKLLDKQKLEHIKTIEAVKNGFIRIKYIQLENLKQMADREFETILNI